MNAFVDNHQHIILVTGPARSGKSEWAEALAVKAQKPITYIATSYCSEADLDWQARVQRHRQRRPADWGTLEVPINLATSIEQATPNTCLLIDSLGTWLANVLDQDEALWQQTSTTLCHSLENCPATVILVAEETGWGVIPAYPAGRSFRDRLGQLTQQIGSLADAVYLVTAGHALNLKVLGTSVSEFLEQ
ncbi:MAG: bifunctional adenosylcobinamide kinase/adenosylcobinamide-phosphate guanylyltransferase [Thermosynechococcaceae cyanobacterium]